MDWQTLSRPHVNLALVLPALMEYSVARLGIDATKIFGCEPVSFESSFSARETLLA